MTQGLELRETSIRLSFTHEGIRHRRTFHVNGAPALPTAANIRNATRLINEIRQRIKLGVFVMSDYFEEDTQSGITVGAQLDSWLQSQRIEASTRAGYTTAIKFWKRHFGDTPLGALVKSDIMKATASRSDLTGKTINNYVSVLRDALSLAVEDRIITESPAANISRAAHQKEALDPFDADEVAAIMESMRTKHPGQVHNLVEFWLWTGLRTSEIFGLQWANVNLIKNTIHVAEAVVRGVRKESTKTNKVRTVVLNSIASAAIKRQQQMTGSADAEVFMDPRYNKPWDDERAFRRSFWTPTLEGLGIRYRRPYNMRHSYATAMLMSGMTPAFCAKQLGHSTEIFFTTYSKWLDGQQNEAEMLRLEQAISVRLPPACPQVGSEEP